MLVLWGGRLPCEVYGRQEASSRQTALVFTDVTVIDATGAPPKPDMTVIVKGDRIAALDKTANLDVPENAHVVDATGKFLIPGLWDMHVHWWNKNFLALFTANGVTGIRMMWGVPEHHKWREEISAGKLIGPRMVISSPIAPGPKPGRDYFPAGSDEDEGRRFVRKVKKEGADLVKVGNYIPRDAYFAMADEAKKQGIPFAGHVPLSVRAAEASDAGQQSIEHCPFVMMACSSEGEEELRKKLKETTRRWKLLADITYSEKKAAELFARFVKNSTWVCPTLLVWHGKLFRDEEDLANDPRLKYIPLSTRDTWKNRVRVYLATGEGRANLKKLCEKHLAIVGAMRDAGVGLLAGTDTPIAYCFPGFGLHDELAVFVQAGLSPMEALQTATRNPAKFFGKLDSMGTIEQGKIADLVLLEANPLQDISNTQKIAAVVVGGRIFDKTALQKMLAQIEATAKKPSSKQGIPGLERTAKGRVFVSWLSGGPRAPAPENTLYLCYSDDRGKTFTAPQPMAGPKEGARAFDPTLWIDPEGRLWYIFNRGNEVAAEHAVHALICDDPDAKVPVWSDEFRVEYEAPYSTRMNKLTVLSSGEWIMPVTHAVQPTHDRLPLQGVAISSNKGKTWTLHGALKAPPSALQNMIVELRDGRLWMLIRTGSGFLWESHSADKGLTWSKAKASTIANPGSRFFIRRLASGNLLLVNHYKFKHRSHITARLSTNDGVTWNEGLLLDERSNVSYPDGMQDKDGLIWIVYDRDRRGDGEILMAKFREEDVNAGKNVSGAVRLKQVIINLK